MAWPLGAAEDAVARDDQEKDVQVRLGVGVHALPGGQADEVGVELPSS